tara:strand:- start:1583 stop:3403 length:1821 start_codon:yes stop_codon:yes gene_type:complete
MNLKNLFNNRNKNFARLSEAGDYLGRRLRENLVIFEIDDAQDTVTYVTESNNLICCNYKEVKGKLTFENFAIDNLDTITSDDSIDLQVEAQISKFIGGLVADKYDTAEGSFDDILSSFSMRAKIEESRKKLGKRIDRFNESFNIKNTKSFKKFNESLPLLEKFLKENKDIITNNDKLIEGLRLSKVVGDTYNLPQLTLEDLKDEFLVIPANTKKTLYEMVCDKELVRKELLEAKESFTNIWAKNDKIGTLASHIYSNDATIKTSLKEAVADVPYLALSNKVDLVSVMESVFQITNPGNISKKDIREFVNKIYEYKKPMKTLVLETLNNVYGVNVQSLRFIPSFKGLAEVQSDVLGILSESCEEGILSDVLKEFGATMNRKGGVQVLDVANLLSDVLAAAEVEVVEIDESFSMKKLSDYLSNDIEEAQYYGDDDKLSNNPGMGSDKKKGKKDKDFGGNKGDIKAKDRKKDDDSKLTADEKGNVDYNKNDLPGDQDELDKDGDGDIDAKDLKKLRGKKKKKVVKEDLGTGKVGHESEDGAEEAEEVESEDAEQQEDAEAIVRDQDQKDLVAKIEDITADIDIDLEADEDTDDEEEAEEKVATDDAAVE